MENIEEFLKWYEDVYRRFDKASDGKVKLAEYQARRIWEFVKNGTRRILYADITGAGKTLYSLIDKVLLDERLGKRTKALIVAPEQAINTAWSDDISEYCQKLGLPRQTVYHIENPSDLNNLSEAVKGYDFVALNYSKLGGKIPKKKSNTKIDRYLKKVLEVLTQFDTIILDEAHNLKNKSAFRTKAFRQIVEQSSDKNYILLSATPIPNRLEDVGILLYLLEPETYGRFLKMPFDYNFDKNAIVKVKAAGKWYRIGREHLRELFSLPELDYQEHKINIEEGKDIDGVRYIDKYFKCWSEIGRVGQKLPTLRKLLIQSKLDALEKMVDDVLSKENAQVLVFTYLKTDILDELHTRFSKRYSDRVAKIDGSTKANIRTEIAKDFREGRYQILLNTTQTMGEGIPLVTYGRPCHIILLEPPVAPGHLDQIIGRVYRIGQEAPVHIHEIIAEAPELLERMRRAVKSGELAKKYKGLIMNASWEPGMVDNDFKKIRVDYKQKLLDQKIYPGLELIGAQLEDLTEEEKIEHEVETPEEAAKANMLTSIPRYRKYAGSRNFLQPVKNTHTLYGYGSEASIAADNFIFAFGIDSYEKYLDSRNKIEKRIKEIIGKTKSHKEFVDTFEKYGEKEQEMMFVAERAIGLFLGYLYYEGSVANRWNDYIARLIEGAEKSEGRGFEMIADLGSGPACLARALKRPVTNVDAMLIQLYEGRYRCELQGINGTYVHTTMQDLSSMQSGSFDWANASHSLMYNAQTRVDGNYKREIEDTLIEVNRILKQGGYFSILLPYQHGQGEQYAQTLKGALEMYGFDPFLVQPIKNKSNKAYLILSKKIKDIDDYCLEEGKLDVWPHDMEIKKLVGGYGRELFY